MVEKVSGDSRDLIRCEVELKIFHTRYFIPVLMV